MQKSNAYLIGRLLGRIPIGVYAIAAAALLIYYISSLPPQPPALAAPVPLAPRFLKPEEVCRNERAERLAQYEAHVQAGNPWQGVIAIRRCAILLSDPELKALADKAEQADWVLTAKNPKESTSARISALDKLRVAQGEASDPSLKAIHTKLVAQLKREREAETRADAARKKREGVTLGMSEADVIASAWGKPKRINRSVYSFGIHEQWVYDGSNYLYFKNGRLDSIQTGQ